MSEPRCVIIKWVSKPISDRLPDGYLAEMVCEANGRVHMFTGCGPTATAAMDEVLSVAAKALVPPGEVWEFVDSRVDG